jgi:ubiquinone/menaquinone biosynthesis C-methylase UbiE
LEDFDNRDISSFYKIQTRTGWSRTLEAFAEWCHPSPGWLTLDVGSGAGYLPALFAGRGCRALGIDIDEAAFSMGKLHSELAVADVFHLPFPKASFDFITASNILFLLTEVESALQEFARILKRDGRMGLLNPSEHLTVQAAEDLAQRHNLRGLDRASLINWATLAEARKRWSESDLVSLLAPSGFVLSETTVKVGPGLARFARITRAI